MEKLKNWIESNPFKWCFLLIFISYGMGIIGVFTFGMSVGQAIIMGTIYSTLLIILELNVRWENQ